MISKIFRARYVAYEAGKSRKFKFFILPFFPLLPHQHLFYYTSTAASILMLDLVSAYRLVLQFCDLFSILEADSRRR